MKFGGGKFNMSKAKTELDWVVYRAAQVPGTIQVTLDPKSLFLEMKQQSAWVPCNPRQQKKNPEY